MPIRNMGGVKLNSAFCILAELLFYNIKYVL